jgi:hypothetical protein
LGLNEITDFRTTAGSTFNNFSEHEYGILYVNKSDTKHQTYELDFSTIKKSYLTSQYLALPERNFDIFIVKD